MHFGFFFFWFNMKDEAGRAYPVSVTLDIYVGVAFDKCIIYLRGETTADSKRDDETDGQTFVYYMAGP